MVTGTCPYISHTPSYPIFPATPSIISHIHSCPILPIIPFLHLHAHHPVLGTALSYWQVWSRAPESVSQLTCWAGYMSNRPPLCDVRLVDVGHSRLHYKIVGSRWLRKTFPGVACGAERLLCLNPRKQYASWWTTDDVAHFWNSCSGFCSW